MDTAVIDVDPARTPEAVSPMLWREFCRLADRGRWPAAVPPEIARALHAAIVADLDVEIEAALARRIR